MQLVVASVEAMLSFHDSHQKQCCSTGLWRFGTADVHTAKWVVVAINRQHDEPEHKGTVESRKDTMSTSERFVAQAIKQDRANIRKSTKKNGLSREVMCTGAGSQLVVMSIPPGQEIGEETQEDIDQTLFIVEGHGEAVLDGNVKPVSEHHAVFVPAGTNRNLKNKGHGRLKLYTVYSRCRASFIF